MRPLAVFCPSVGGNRQGKIPGPIAPRRWGACAHQHKRWQRRAQGRRCATARCHICPERPVTGPAAQAPRRIADGTPVRPPSFINRRRLPTAPSKATAAQSIFVHRHCACWSVLTHAYARRGAQWVQSWTLWSVAAAPDPQARVRK